jgi:hypothetical protein
MSGSDVTYVVFCRIDGIKEMSSEEVALAVGTLAQVVEEATRDASGERLPSHSSVYGRLVLVPRKVLRALELARQLLRESAARGVWLGIGVARGRIESTQDLLEHNIAGTVVNRAARLAHLDGGTGRIALDKRVAEAAVEASPDYKKAFPAQPIEGKVKRSVLHYHWLPSDLPKFQHGTRPVQPPESETAHVVVYDIAGFSDLEQSDLVDVVERLSHAVRRALQRAHVDDPHQAQAAGRLWYAPAGDGGVIVFHADQSGGRAAWGFATALLDHTHERVPVRVGLTTGEVVVLKDNLPVGKGVFDADHFSGLPETGEICCGAGFWNDTLEKEDRRGWTARKVPGDEKALLLAREGVKQEAAQGAQRVGQSAGEGQQQAPGEASAGVSLRDVASGPNRSPAPPQAQGRPRAAGLRCLLVLSEAEKTATNPLEAVAREALDMLHEDPLVFQPVESITGTEAIASRADFVRTIRQLCTAEVALFDITHFEPAVMLLLGIRAVVRRGISILSMGGVLALESIIELPFNIKDANLVSHSEKQQEDRARPPWLRIYQRIADGLKQMHSREYLDLPAFDAVRNLPPTERRPLPPEECILVLASFSRRYISDNWNKRVFPGLHYQQELLRKRLKKPEESKPRYGIARSVDLDSPRLVSHAIYSFILRSALCIVDWTDWRPNVFFELGVRVAAGKGRTVCLIDKSHLDIWEKPERVADEVERLGLAVPADGTTLDDTVRRVQAIAEQAEKLANLFDCFPYEVRRKDDQLLARAVGNQSPPIPECLAVVEGRAAIAESLDVAGEPVAVPLHRELLQSATRFAADDTEAISAILFPNERLRQVAAAAVKERMRAAWHYLVGNYSAEMIAGDDLLRGEFAVLAEEMSKDEAVVSDPTFLEHYERIDQAIALSKKRSDGS